MIKDPTPDDLLLIKNTIKECLANAGKSLHPPYVPEVVVNVWASSGSRVCTNAANLAHAQFWLSRAQLLREMDPADAAVYLREELLDALAAAGEEEERRRAAPKNTVTLSQVMGLVPVSKPASVTSVIMGQLEQLHISQGAPNVQTWTYSP